VCKKITGVLPQRKQVNNTTLPPEPVAINQCRVITNLPAFIESHFATLKASNGNKIFTPFLNRLQTFKNILEYET
jgi:hypothetical protein